MGIWSALVILLPALTAQAAAPQECVRAEIVLWGDGRHDDTAALNAWFSGRDAIWGEDGAPVGATIVGHSFRLSAAVYIPGGTGRSLEGFRMLWPERGEVVSGGVIRSSDDPNEAPVLVDVSITGGDSGEGKPLQMPDSGATPINFDASCATS